MFSYRQKKIERERERERERESSCFDIKARQKKEYFGSALINSRGYRSSLIVYFSASLAGCSLLKTPFFYFQTMFEVAHFLERVRKRDGNECMAGKHGLFNLM